MPNLIKSSGAGGESNACVTYLETNAGGLSQKTCGVYAFEHGQCVRAYDELTDEYGALISRGDRKGYSYSGNAGVYKLSSDTLKISDLGISSVEGGNGGVAPLENDVVFAGGGHISGSVAHLTTDACRITLGGIRTALPSCYLSSGLSIMHDYLPLTKGAYIAGGQALYTGGKTYGIDSAMCYRYNPDNTRTILSRLPHYTYDTCCIPDYLGGVLVVMSALDSKCGDIRYDINDVQIQTNILALSLYTPRGVTAVNNIIYYSGQNGNIAKVTDDNLKTTLGRYGIEYGCTAYLYNGKPVIGNGKQFTIDENDIVTSIHNLPFSGIVRASTTLKDGNLFLVGNADECYVQGKITTRVKLQKGSEYQLANQTKKTKITEENELIYMEKGINQLWIAKGAKILP